MEEGIIYLYGQSSGYILKGNLSLDCQ